MIKYSTWSQIPAHLKTRTQLASLGLKPAPDQQPVAQRTGGYGPYDLYDLNAAIPKRPPSEAQLAALETARNALRKHQKCPRCKQYNYAEDGTLCDECHAADGRRQAQKWAREILALNFIVLDTETTGLDPIADAIIEIAILDNAGGVLLNTLINPSFPIPPDATAIHGIDDAMCAKSPTLADIAPTLLRTLTEAECVVIYNAAFDTAMLRNSLRSIGLRLPAIRTECAMHIYAAFFGQWDRNHHDYHWQRLPSAGHRALDDARATLDILRQMAQEQP